MSGKINKIKGKLAILMLFVMIAPSFTGCGKIRQIQQKQRINRMKKLRGKITHSLRHRKKNLMIQKALIRVLPWEGMWKVRWTYQSIV